MINKFKTKLLIILSATLASLLVLAGAFMLSPKTTAHADEGNTGVAAACASGMKCFRAKILPRLKYPAL